MNRIAYLGFSLLMILTAAIPILAQAPTEPPDVTAYRTLYGEKDPAKQAELSEKFLAETAAAFKDSMYRENTFSIMFRNYLQLQRWDKVLDAAEKMNQTVPNARPQVKVTTNTQAMAVAQQTNNVPKTLEFGEKVLALDANNLNALITLAPVLVARLPEEPSAKDAALAKAMEYAKKALAQSKPANVPDAQWTGVQSQMHSTIGFVHLNKLQYPEAIVEYEIALKADPKDAVDQWRLGLAYQGLARTAQGPVVEAYNKWNDARVAKADQAVIDDLDAQRISLEKAFKEKRDKAIDTLAKAVALGGAVAPLARPTLETLYKSSHEGSLEGLDNLIAEKKAELGVK